MDSAEEQNNVHEAVYKHQLHHQHKSPRDASSPFYHQRLSSFASPLHEFETTPAYMLRWDPKKQCRRTIVGSPDDLRELISGMDKDGPVTLFVFHGLPANYVDILRTSEELSIDSAFLDAHATRRSYCSRSGLTLPRRRGHSNIRSAEAGCFAQFEYPELIQGFDCTSMSRRETHHSSGAGFDGLDLMITGPKVLPLTEDGKTPKGLAAAFNRASLWISSTRQQNPRAGVLFLDKPLWRDAASSHLRKASFPTARKTSPVMDAQRPRVAAPDAYDDREDEEVPCLEDLIYEMLCHNSNEHAEVVDPPSFIANVLSDIVYNHWLELFEVLAPPTASQPKLIEREVSKSITLYWYMVQSLERNADVTAFYADHNGRIKGSERGFSSGSDWKTLLSRAKRRIALLNASPGVPILLPIPTPPENPPTCVTQEKVKPSKKRPTAMSSTAKVTNIPLSRTTTPGNNLNRIATYASLTPQRSHLLRISSHQHGTSNKISADNQRALERISYLGGILLPFPIVSGILSMGDEYGPGAPKFFIFWAVVIPLSVVACLIIYADIVRKAEVWVEVATERVVVSSLSSAAAVFPYPLPDLPVGVNIDDTGETCGTGVTDLDRNRGEGDTEETPPKGFLSLKTWRWWIGKLIWQKHKRMKRQMEMRRHPTHDHGTEVNMDQEEGGSYAHQRGQTDEEQTIGINPFVGNTDRTGFYPPPDTASPTAQPFSQTDPHRQRPSLPPSFQLPTATGSHYGDSNIQDNGRVLNEETVDTTPITPLSPGHVHLMMMPPGMTLAQTTSYPDPQRRVGFDADTETETTQMDESEEGSVSGEALPRVILEMTPSNGIKPKAWKRQELGWYGAVKRIVNPKQLRALEDVPVGVEAHERQKSSASGIRRRKTRTY
ncbi:hypothetical protein GE21DRAFT_3214 [Neurospora crassa]|uniref:Uncharacterized protein n=2 Tax=Neurospora crassa TaxID=5141 RepID=Q1K550_NEUCR|nr:hypothetical protein NCU01798 [Neurospora crassa OR74A]EAA27240.1 hypothetical protein NCU01798 [Neurospora crassa OR74A]KHE79402.1 hypothetical protein GE21DRAFT_3214 [Neurospora crassa]CAD21179.1 hypothetical protein [Neurospora crassa]|eukprot:XP_956476.1 hypothetical protein NCU01798 [Neurospora crassa OR74A]